MGRGSAPVATFLSYRLGGTDGVSIEAAKWMEALETSGFATRRVAGRLTGRRAGATSRSRGSRSATAAIPVLLTSTRS